MIASTSNSTHRSRISSSSDRVNTLPVGLLGVLTMMAFVFLWNASPQLLLVERPLAAGLARWAQLHEAWIRTAQNRIRTVVFRSRARRSRLHRLCYRPPSAWRSSPRSIRSTPSPCFSGSTFTPCHARICRAIAPREALRTPRDRVLVHVGADRFLRCLLDLRGSGKSGNPCARLMAPCTIACRVISRITDSGKMRHAVAEKVL